MGSNIAMADLLRAAEEFAVPQIEIIQPKIVICLGLNSFNAIRKSQIALVRIRWKRQLIHHFLLAKYGVKPIPEREARIIEKSTE